MELARLGDTLECRVRNPLPGVLTCRLDTPESVATANELLLSSPDGGWILKPYPPIKTTYSCNVFNCGDGKCVHKLLDERCPICRSNMVLVTRNGHKFCCNDPHSCDYEE